MDSESVLPCPLFEGSEKRLVAGFSFGAASPVEGLRALSRGQLDALLCQAACCIVSCRSNEDFDAYVLSESSLFVYPERLVLKTCGTTALLAAVPMLLELAASLDMRPLRFKYSRASFLFPMNQPAPYQAFEDEVAFLETYVGSLGGGGNAYVLGDALHGLRWHVYVAAEHRLPNARQNAAADHSIEVCMTSLCPAKAAQFARSCGFISARHTTIDTGIADLLPAADIDEYVFEPCGYSMNGLQGGAFSTIHVTPEAACSYASVELTGCAHEDVAAFVAKSAEIFRPGKMTVAVTAAAGTPPAGVFAAGYTVAGTSAQIFPCGSSVVVYSLQASGVTDAPTMEQEEKGLVAAGKVGAAMEDDRMSQVSELTAFDIGALAGSGLFARGLTNSACFGSDDENANGACGGGNASIAMSASYASSQASEAAKSRPATPEPDWQMVDKPAPAVAGGDAPADRASLLAGVLARYSVLPLPSGDAAMLDAYLSRLIRQHQLEDPVCIVDLGRVARLFSAWMAAMPRVMPFYAVKCNNDEAILSTLAALGAGFDCASDAELDMVLRLGVPTERIVFANACKRPRDIRRAAAKQVNLTTFDTASELGKLARWHPGTRALLRIRADDPAARCQLGNKYGAESADAPALLQAAKEMGIAVCGVSFHVGSGATNPDAFSEAIALARAAFHAGTGLGFVMDTLDIGGGFCDGSAMGDVAAAVNAALDLHFPVSSGVRIIAEPGRYFAEACATLGCMVFGVRDGCCAKSGAPVRDYWITDGIYGSMNSLLYDHATVAPRPLRPSPVTDATAPYTGATGDDSRLIRGCVFGPTCDGLDTVVHDYALPKLEVGDWLVFSNHGAYTFVGACAFNGMDPAPATFYVFSAK
ncbi:g5250 [Coccomyxa elongata]